MSVRAFVLFAAVLLVLSAPVLAAKGAPGVEEYKDVPPGLLVPPETPPPPPPKKGLPARLGDIPGVFRIPGEETKEEAKGALSMDQIMRLYREGKYDIVLQNLTPMIKTQQHAAEELLGIMYFQGQGVEKNDATALQLLTEAAEAGQTVAQHYLGVMYFTGAGMDAPDNIKALMWLHIAILHYQEGPEKKRAEADRDAVYVRMTRLEKARAIEMARTWLTQRGEGPLMDMQR